MTEEAQSNVLRDPVTGLVISMDYASEAEKRSRGDLLANLLASPIPHHSVLANLGLFQTSKTFSRLVFMHEFYKMGLGVMGQVFDFGTRWGQNMAIWIAVRDMLEPFNRHRKIVGFDTFGGFPSTAAEDGSSEMIGVGNIPVTDNYPDYLKMLLTTLECNTALPHLKRFELVQGDASETVRNYFEANPHAIVSHAFFDFDLYEPTRDCLRAVWNRMPKGAVLGFDEVNDPDSPGETQAIIDVLGIDHIRLQRFPWVSRVSYIVKE